MTTFPFTSLVKSLSKTVPFVGPEALERQTGRAIAVRIGANESAFGVSPKAREAMQTAIEDLCFYNDPENFELGVALAAHHGVRGDEICISAGVDDLLGLMVRIIVEPGDPVVTSLGTYPTFNYHVHGFGGRLEQVPYADDRADLQGLIDRVRASQAHLVYLANPDNPMGTWYSGDDVSAFVEALPDDCIAVIDEAYSDFAPPQADWVMNGCGRAVRMRTFSKAHGMAGARVGYVVGHRDIVIAIDKVRNHFGVNRVAQVGALASLRDRGFVASVVEEVIAGRVGYERLAVDLNLSSLPSATNFVCFDIGDSDRARSVLEKLLLRGVFVRTPSQPPQSRCIRVTVGTQEQRDTFASVFRDVLQEL